MKVKSVYIHADQQKPKEKKKQYAENYIFY